MITESEIIKETNKLLSKGYTAEEIEIAVLTKPSARKINEQGIKLVKTLITKAIAEVKERYDEIQLIKSGRLLHVKNEKKFKIYTQEFNALHEFDYPNASKYIDKHFLSSRITPVNSIYEPKEVDRFFKRAGITYFNEYIAADWMLEKLQPDTTAEIPPICKEFLLNLFNQHSESYEYVLDWMAESILGKNIVALCTIGTGGVGKQLLFKLMAQLHGAHNSERLNPQYLFELNNGLLLNKTLVYQDEFSISNQKDEDRFKDFANETIAVVDKYEKKRVIKNVLNLYISNNNLDAIRVVGKDRRLSIVNLTSIQTDKWPGWADVNAKLMDLLSPDTIRQLAKFLISRTYNRQRILSEPLVTDRTNEVRAASVTDWEDWFLQSYCKENAGKEVQIPNVVDTIVHHFNNSKLNSLNFASFQRLEAKIAPKKYFEAKRVSFGESKLRAVKILPKSEQPDTYENHTK